MVWTQDKDANLKKYLEGTPQVPQPDFVEPMLATLAGQPFDDPGWIYEVKWDGYRTIASVKDGRVTLWSRGHKDYSDVFSPVAQELSQLEKACVLDGEMVILDELGKPKFEDLQNYRRTRRGALIYYVFDVPYADGRALRQLPLVQRKAVAELLVGGLKQVRISDHVETRGRDFFKAAQDQNIEGVMAKAVNSPYQDGKRSRYWLKIRNHMRQEAVICGYTDPRGARKGIGALVVGSYENGDLKYMGHVGSGLSDRNIDDLLDKLSHLKRKSSPFKVVPTTNAPVHWVKPKLVAEVEFSEWTNDGLMRHPRFLGLREDKSPQEVFREQPVESPNKVELNHRDKVLWPEQGYTKGTLIDYYDEVSEIILPYLKGRPESLLRFPHGPFGPSFFQKNLVSHPDWVETVPIFSESNGKEIMWLVVNDKKSLLYMVGLACIELNPWLSQVNTLERPDFCLIDLDAKTGKFEDIIRSAQVTHGILDEAEIPSFVKTSGKTGLHICVPLAAQYTFEQSRKFAELIADLVHQALPDITSVDRTPDKRKGLIYLDYLQNRRGQTMAAPYCVRPFPEATVSTPLKWSEVRIGLDPKKYTLATIRNRIDEMGDLWAGVLGAGIDMQRALARLSKRAFSKPS